jgi:SAM-dependent methyltransferase
MSDYTGVDNLEVMRVAVNYNRHLCEIVRTYDPLESEVIDFGAGLGTFSACIEGDRSRVLCVEADTRLRARLQSQGYRTVSAPDDIPEASIGYIFSLNVLEHIADDERAVMDLARCLRPGGRLLLYLPAFPVLFSSMDHKVGHYRRYTREHIAPMLSRAGLRVSVAKYEDFLGFFATLLFKGIDRRNSGDIDPSALAFYDRWAYPASRILARVFGRWVGKNLLVVAEKDGAAMLNGRRPSDTPSAGTDPSGGSPPDR